MSAIKATFHTARPVPSRGVVSFVFDVPTREAGAALALLGGFPDGGESVWVGIARLTPEAAAKPSPKERYDAADEGRQAVTRAALLCADPDFQRWLLPENHKRDPSANGEVTANLVRMACKVESRAALATDPEALARFIDLENRYRTERSYGSLATRFGPHATR